MIVYVVETHGSCIEEYERHAIFSSRSNAEAHAAWLNGPADRSYGAEVSEVTLDPPTPRTGRWKIEGDPEDFLADDLDDDGWWVPESTESTHGTRDWVYAFGKDRESAIRSGKSLARKLLAPTPDTP